MTLAEAYLILELEPSDDDKLIKEQYRWWVKFYHPDNKYTGNAIKFQQIIEAYRVINGF